MRYKMNDFKSYLDTIKKMAMEEGYDSLDETYVEHLRARYFGEDVMIGKSSRVLLRELKESDLQVLYYLQDSGKEPSLEAFVKDSYEESLEALKSYIDTMYPLYDYGIWAAESVSDGSLLGLCGIGDREVNGKKYTNLGYYICPPYRRQGFATECIQIVLDYAKKYLEFSVIYAIIKEENRISEDILCKFGFHIMEKHQNVRVYQKELGELQ